MKWPWVWRWRLDFWIKDASDAHEAVREANKRCVGLVEQQRRHEADLKRYVLFADQMIDAIKARPTISLNDGMYHGKCAACESKGPVTLFSRLCEGCLSQGTRTREEKS